MYGLCNLAECQDEATEVVPCQEGFPGPHNWRDALGMKRQMLLCPSHAAILRSVE
jgi:hypothetical protein